MIKLYNARGSVCSVKARIGLAEKQLEWEDIFLSLPDGDQDAPEYRQLNPNGVVPTLVDNETVVIESSVILQYADELGDAPQLMPKDKALRAEARVWLLRTLELHQAIATMTFSTINRLKWLNTKTPEEIEADVAMMPNPLLAAKRRDLIDNGVNSQHVEADFFVLSRIFEDVNTLLEKRDYLNGDSFGMADVALLAYFDRLDRLYMSGMWQETMPRISEWLNLGRARASYSRAMDSYVSPQQHAKNLSMSEKFWPEIEKQWLAFRSNQ